MERGEPVGPATSPYAISRWFKSSHRGNPQIQRWNKNPFVYELNLPLPLKEKGKPLLGRLCQCPWRIAKKMIKLIFAFTRLPSEVLKDLCTCEHMKSSMTKTHMNVSSTLRKVYSGYPSHGGHATSIWSPCLVVALGSLVGLVHRALSVDLLINQCRGDQWDIPGTVLSNCPLLDLYNMWGRYFPYLCVHVRLLIPG